MAKKPPLKIKVIGTGGIGLCLLPTLARFLNYSEEKFPYVELSLVDGDEFEPKNLDRQKFEDFGPKASVTAEAYRKEFDRLTIYDHPVYVDDANIKQLIVENDIVLLCVDNHATRKLVSDRAEKLKNVTIISGGNDLTDGNVLTHIRRDGKNITLPIASFHQAIANPTDENPAYANKAAGCAKIVASSPQVLIMNNYIGANMLAMFYTVVSDFDGKAGIDVIKAKAEKYSDVYCDLKTVASTPALRKVN
jgi:molybdopterin/thiamine biosynthesis adenylyltransferase